jgi:hypothetical protein
VHVLNEVIPPPQTNIGGFRACPLQARQQASGGGALQTTQFNTIQTPDGYFGAFVHQHRNTHAAPLAHVGSSDMIDCIASIKCVDEGSVVIRVQ